MKKLLLLAALLALAACEKQPEKQPEKIQLIGGTWVPAENSKPWGIQWMRFSENTVKYYQMLAYSGDTIYENNAAEYFTIEVNDTFQYFYINYAMGGYVYDSMFHGKLYFQGEYKNKLILQYYDEYVNGLVGFGVLTKK
jgi:hypothetical protein